jgi:hypothetical protein
MNESITLSRKLGRAIFAIGLGQNQSALLCHVLEHSPAPCPINAARLAEHWDTYRQRIYEAKVWLQRARILVEESGGMVVNPDVISWTKQDGRTPLLVDPVLSYCLDVSGPPPRLPQPLVDLFLDASPRPKPASPSVSPCQVCGERRGGCVLCLPGRQVRP